MKKAKSRFLFIAVLAAAVFSLTASEGVTANQREAQNEWSSGNMMCVIDPETGECQQDYDGDYSSPGYAAEVDPYTAQYGGWQDTNPSNTDGYEIYSVNSADAGEVLEPGGVKNCWSTVGHPPHVQHGTFVWEKHIWQQAYWCRDWNDKILSWRVRGTADTRGSNSFCSASQPSTYKIGGGVGSWYVDVETDAHFACNGGTLNYSYWMVTTYMAGPPGTAGDFGWTHN